MWKQENTNIFDKKNVALRYLSSSAFLAIKPGKLEVYHFCTLTHSWTFAKSFLCRSPSHRMREWTFLEISRKRLVAQSPEHSFFFVMCYDPSLADGCYLVEQEGAYAFPEFLEFDICYRVHFYSPLKKFLSLSLMGAAQDSGIIAFRVSSGVQRNTLIAQSMVLTLDLDQKSLVCTAPEGYPGYIYDFFVNKNRNMMLVHSLDHPKHLYWRGELSTSGLKLLPILIDPSIYPCDVYKYESYVVALARGAQRDSEGMAYYELQLWDLKTLHHVHSLFWRDKAVSQLNPLTEIIQMEIPLSQTGFVSTKRTQTTLQFFDVEIHKNEAQLMWSGLPMKAKKDHPHVLFAMDGWKLCQTTSDRLALECWPPEERNIHIQSHIHSHVPFLPKVLIQIIFSYYQSQNHFKSLISKIFEHVPL